MPDKFGWDNNFGNNPAPTRSGQKIIDGLKDAVDGNLARVTIEGQVWIRETPSTAAAPGMLALLKRFSCHSIGMNDFYREARAVISKAQQRHGRASRITRQSVTVSERSARTR